MKFAEPDVQGELPQHTSRELPVCTFRERNVNHGAEGRIVASLYRDERYVGVVGSGALETCLMIMLLTDGARYFRSVFW